MLRSGTESVDCLYLAARLTLFNLIHVLLAGNSLFMSVLVVLGTREMVWVNASVLNDATLTADLDCRYPLMVHYQHSTVRFQRDLCTASTINTGENGTSISTMPDLCCHSVAFEIISLA